MKMSLSLIVGAVIIKNDQLSEFEELSAINCIAIEEIAKPYRSKVEAMIAAYRPKDNGKILVETKIVLRDQTVYFRLPPKISEWMKTEIKPSQSEYASPAVIVKRWFESRCIDYRQLNKKIIRDNRCR